MNNDDVKKIEKMAFWIRKKSLKLAYAAGKNGAHLGSAFSCVEIISCLYGHVMELDDMKAINIERDVFIPSKAHCVLTFYSALAYCGFFPVSDLENFEKNGSELPGHPVMNQARGIEFSGGSLGMGFSQGVGIALAMKKKKINNYVYVLLGDGECDEGANWEAAMSAAHFHLNNLVIIVDANKLQYDGATNEVMCLANLKDKFSTFGFHTYETNGHDVSELLNTFAQVRALHGERPIAVIAHTIKGKGVSFMENQKQWHHAVLSEDNFNEAMKELEDAYGIE